MKRKLNLKDVPEPASDCVLKEEPSFRDLGLDFRILQAISKQDFKKPTTVQSNAIPLALNGNDIIARARTGSGKTAAYLLPIIHSILKRKQISSTPFISALILVPTRELAEQVHKVTESFCMFCANDVRSINLTQKVSEAVIQSLLADSPDIIVSTPSKALTALRNPSVSLDKLTSLVIDEADLVLSYGYEEDLQAVAKIIPKRIQTCLMSATITDEVTKLNKLFCNNATILKLDESDNKTENLSQFVVKCSEEEKFLLAYVIFKLRLVKGKCIIFVGDIDRCYRVKLFLEQFGIRSCILNSELPVNTRIHVVDEFNKGVYDIIIASDELEMLGNEDESKEDEDNPEIDLVKVKNVNPEETGKVVKFPNQKLSKKKKRQTINARDYGVSRGIDFKNVACVINFDLPTSSRSYIHRIGRTARAGQTGMALSFVITADQYRKHPPTSIESTKNDEKVLARIMKHQNKIGQELKPYNFDMEQVASFRYRLHDALRAVTKIAIREARTKELRQELIKSDKLKQYFEENPGDLYHLRHDSELRPARVQSHLKHVPDYLLPNGGQKALIPSTDGQHISLHKTRENRIRKARLLHKARTNKIKSKRASDPLKTFKMKARS